MLLAGQLPMVQAQEGMRMEWAASFEERGADASGSGSGSDEGLAIISDAEGNVYTAGYFTKDTVDFDPGSSEEILASAGGQDIFISKQAPDGTLIWARRFGALSDDAARALSLDGEGNLYVAGKFSHTVDFSTTSTPVELVSMGGSDAFILKLSPNGEYIWVKRMGGTRTDGAQDMAVDAAGNIYITGQFARTADFDPDPASNYDLTAGSALLDVFITKLDNDGNFIWAKQLGPAGGFALINTAGIEVAPSGQQIYLSGYFGLGTNFDFDPGSGTEILNPVGMYDIFVLKLDSAGNLGWVKQMGGSGSISTAIDLALDAQENVYTTGSFSATVDFDPGPSTHPRTSLNNDMYISKLDSAGNFVWVTNSTGTSDSSMVEGKAIVVDDEGNAYVTGIFENTVNFFSSGVAGDLTSSGRKWKIFVSKVDGSGGLEWVRQMESEDTLQSTGSALHLDPTGEKLFLTGWFTGTVDFDPGPDIRELVCGGTPPNGYDVFVAQYCVAKLDPLVSINAFQLGTVDSYYSYQWLLEGLPIEGATDRYYDVKANGNYRVVIFTESGCVDTSEVYPVTNYTNSIGDVNGLAAQIKVYPNPVKDLVHIDAPIAVDVLISSIEGKLIREVKGARDIAVESLAEGVYFLQLRDPQGQLIKVVKILKSR